MPLAATEAEQQAMIHEMEERWDKALIEAEPAIIRTYHENIAIIDKMVGQYGLPSVCSTFGLQPAKVADLLADRGKIERLAEQRDIDLSEPVTREEREQYQEFAMAVFAPELREIQEEYVKQQQIKHAASAITYDERLDA